jgi:hypothetical protein
MYVTEKSSDTTRNASRDRPTSSAAILTDTMLKIHRTVRDLKYVSSVIKG